MARRHDRDRDSGPRPRGTGSHGKRGRRRVAPRILSGCRSPVGKMNARQVRVSAIGTVLLCGLLAWLSTASAADKEHWRNVKGASVRSLLQDKEFGDGVHFAYRFKSDGTFSGMEMGRR